MAKGNNRDKSGTTAKDKRSPSNVKETLSDYSFLLSVLSSVAVTALWLGPCLYLFYRGMLPLLWGGQEGRDSPLLHVNDICFHQTLTQRILESGTHDAWVPQWGGGAAVLRYYQNFSHLVAASVSLLTGVSALTSVVFVNAVFLGVYPFCVFWAARQSGLAPFAAGFASLLTLIVGADTTEKHLFGLQTWSFTWEGWGLYTQIVAAVWGFLCWGNALRWVVHGSGYLRASVFLAFCWLSHLIVGYGMSAVTVVLVVGVYSRRLQDPLRALGGALLRWLAMNLTAAFLISYLIVPTLVEAHILNRSRFEPAEYWDSYGAPKVLRWLFQGRLLDRVHNDSAWYFLVGNRPVFTVTVLLGLLGMAGFCLYRLVLTQQENRREEQKAKHVLLVLGAFFAALVLFTGRSTFGPKLLRLVPFSINLPFHRFFVHFHMFALLAAGWALWKGCRLVVWLLGRVLAARPPFSRDRAHLLGIALCAVLIGGLVVYPIGSHLSGRTKQHIVDLEAQNKDTVEWWGNATYTLMKQVADRVHENPGRAYAGAGWNWGREFTLKFSKVYSLWTQRGLYVPNISYMWHAMGLNSEMDNHLVENRPDHHALFNLRYVLCRPGTASPPARQVTEEVGGHAIYEWTAAKGYFSLVQLVGCVSAHYMPKDSFWLWREQYVMATDTHGLGRHYRTALKASEACKAAGEERVDEALPQGEVVAQEGNVDDFQATIRCDEPKGCTVLVRITYHPLFECRRASTNEVIPTFALSPSYVGFVAPQGLDTYNVRWRTPLWSKLLFYICYGTMFTFLALSFTRTRNYIPLGLSQKKKNKKE